MFARFGILLHDNAQPEGGPDKVIIEAASPISSGCHCDGKNNVKTAEACDEESDVGREAFEEKALVSSNVQYVLGDPRFSAPNRAPPPRPSESFRWIGKRKHPSCASVSFE